MTGDLSATSRFLSYVLRHNPSAIGASLDEAGWVSIDILLAAAARHGHSISRDALTQLTHHPGKRRFEIRGNKIRAAQGHSIPVDLQLRPLQPPSTLYHGTVERYLPSIMTDGLKPGQRNQVHLSADPTAAASVPPRCTTAGTSSTAPTTGSGLPATFHQSGSAPTTANIGLSMLCASIRGRCGGPVPELLKADSGCNAERRDTGDQVAGAVAGGCGRGDDQYGASQPRQ